MIDDDGPVDDRLDPFLRGARSRPTRPPADLEPDGEIADEIAALQAMVNVLEGLTPAARHRLLDWAHDRYDDR